MENYNKSFNRRKRDNEFLDMYKSALMLALDKKVAAPHSTAISLALLSGSPRYFVSYDRAYKVAKTTLRTGKCPVHYGELQPMWEEFVEKVRQVRDIVPGISIAKAVQWVLDNCCASRFFMSRRYATNHIYVAAAERRNNRFRRYMNTPA